MSLTSELVPTEKEPEFKSPMKFRPPTVMLDFDPQLMKYSSGRVELADERSKRERKWRRKKGKTTMGR